ncbi:MAG: TSUP family transporter, partial [Pseudomonadota bacterium]
MSPADIPADLLFILILVAGGALVGILAGLFGIGGGTFIVPMMYEIMRYSSVPAEWRMHVAVGTSLAVIIPVS